MTIVSIARSGDEILCYSDSRITQKLSAEKHVVSADTFPKLLLVPYRATAEKLTDETVPEIKGEFGFAYAGDVVFAVGLHAMCSNMFLNLHAVDGGAPPALEDFATLAASLANILHERVLIFNGSDSKRLYSAFMFGVCPKEKTLKAFEIGLNTDCVPYRFSSRQLELTEGRVYSIGSGVYSFNRAIKRLEESGRKFTLMDALFEAIQHEGDETIGGVLQQCVARVDGVEIVPIIMAPAETYDFNVYVSGVDTSLLDPISGYRVGRKATGYRTVETLEEKWLIDHGYSANRDENPDYINEQSRIMVLIGMWASSPKPIAGIHSYIRVESPIEVEKGRMYFFGRCGKCNRPTPVLDDPTNGILKEPFFGGGGFIGSCRYCGGDVRVKAKSLRSRINEI